ncbi:MAG TPA: hypothetical protein VFJ90_05470, partial [Candidatus Didemnitutus sp.]|nr:hypothetical protein [Candidatus Didemnitutus sp.]
MTAATPPSPSHDAASPDLAITVRFEQSLEEIHRHHDRFFARVLVGQWLFTIVLAFVLSPRAWSGSLPPHLQVLTTLLLGGVISLLPAWLGLNRPGLPGTRLLIGAAQMLMSALLIHLTNGRLESHFLVFVSLAFLALYRDLRVLALATTITLIDQLVAGALWPEATFGVTDAA